MEYKIDKDVPIPPANHSSTKGKTWGFSETLRSLGVGDSSFAEKTLDQASSIIDYVRRNSSFRFKCRTREENGVLGVRVWRIE